MQSLREAQEMTLYEYALRMKAHEYKTIDRLHDLHYHAWLTSRVVSAKDQNDKYVFKSFEDLFDKEKAIKELSGESQREKDETFNRLKERQKRMQEFENMRRKEENDE